MVAKKSNPVIFRTISVIFRNNPVICRAYPVIVWTNAVILHVTWDINLD